MLYTYIQYISRTRNIRNILTTSSLMTETTRFLHKLEFCSLNSRMLMYNIVAEREEKKNEERRKESKWISWLALILVAAAAFEEVPRGYALPFARA